MTAEEWDWKALAAAVSSSRRSLGLTQAALAQQAGVNVHTIASLEAGVVRARMPWTIGRIEKTLTWLPGDARLVLTGATAVPRKSVTPPPARLTSLASPQALRSLESAINYTATTVNVGYLRSLLAELEFLRERLSIYEPLPAPVEDDAHPF